MSNTECGDEVKVSYECMNACLVNHFRRAGIDIAGSDIYFSGSGHPVFYKKGSKVKIASEGFDANFRFLEKYKVPYFFGRLTPEKKVLKECLEKSDYVTIRMSSEFITYNRVFAQTRGATHFVNVIAYDEQKDSFYIEDGDVPTTKKGSFAGWIPASEIEMSWMFVDGETLQLDLRDYQITEELIQQIKSDACEQVGKAIEEYLSKEDRKLSLKVYGQKALVYMLRDVKKVVGRQDLRELTTDMNTRMRINGYMGFKEFMLEKMQEAKHTELAIEYEQLIDGWSKWCMLLLRSGIRGDMESFVSLQTRLEELNAKEEQILRGLLWTYKKKE